MIKKHVILCTVILALLVMAKVFAYNMFQTTENLPKAEIKTLTKTTTTTTPAKAPLSQMAQLNFAEETLPLGDAKVERKMKKILAAYNYSKIHTNRLHQKASEWFPVIEPILAAHGIPDDFKYIALVESGLKSGVSPKGATGIWQFMPGTARHYGLKINSKVDERYNLKKSTVAAARYIKDLYGVFESWTLVAAAYNVGDNHIRKQIDRQNQDNYFKLRLNAETGGYVYKLISMKEIMEDPESHGYKLPRTLLAFHKGFDSVLVE